MGHHQGHTGEPSTQYGGHEHHRESGGSGDVDEVSDRWPHRPADHDGHDEHRHGHQQRHDPGALLRTGVPQAYGHGRKDQQEGQLQEPLEVGQRRGPAPGQHADGVRHGREPSGPGRVGGSRRATHERPREHEQTLSGDHEGDRSPPPSRRQPAVGEEQQRQQRAWHEDRGEPVDVPEGPRDAGVGEAHPGLRQRRPREDRRDRQHEPADGVARASRREQGPRHTPHGWEQGGLPADLAAGALGEEERRQADNGSDGRRRPGQQRENRRALRPRSPARHGAQYAPPRHRACGHRDDGDTEPRPTDEQQQVRLEHTSGRQQEVPDEERDDEGAGRLGERTGAPRRDADQQHAEERPDQVGQQRRDYHPGIRHQSVVEPHGVVHGEHFRRDRPGHEPHRQDVVEPPQPPQHQRDRDQGQPASGPPSHVGDAEQSEGHEQRAEDQEHLLGAVDRDVLGTPADLVVEVPAAAEEIADVLAQPVRQRGEHQAGAGGHLQCVGVRRGGWDSGVGGRADGLRHGDLTWVGGRSRHCVLVGSARTWCR